MIGSRGYLLSDISQTERDSTTHLHLYIESKKINKWRNKTQIHGYKGKNDGCQRGGNLLRGMDEKGKRVKK